MILYRAMSIRELRSFKQHKTIKPSMESVRCKNSWDMALVTFFGTANNALHWATRGEHDIVVAFRINHKLVKEGWGIYPDLDSVKISKEKTGMFLVECNSLKVREYGIPCYNDREARIANCMIIHWEDKQKSRFALPSLDFDKVELEVKSNYDDILERLEREQ